MARSSLLGIDPAPTTASGRDTASLGPGDSSDSGVDRVFTRGESDLGDAASQAALNLAGEVEGEDEDEDDEEAGEKAAAAPARPARRSAAPRQAGDETDEDLPGEVNPAERRPGRD